MTSLRFSLRALGILLHCLFGIALEFVVFPFLGTHGRALVAGWWCRVVVLLVGVRVIHNGPGVAPGELVISNHVSWLDVFGINKLRSVHFVAKSEVRAWPLLGLIAQRSGTIFIERGRRHAVHEVIRIMADKLRNGEACAFFPEGTTTLGDQLLPFHANLIQAAFEAQQPVRPIVVRYLRYGEPTTLAAYVGDQTLMSSMWQILGSTGLELELNVLEALAPKHFETRHALSTRARELITERLGLLPATGVEQATPEPMHAET
jgi:1-acyl-sn-glycerol-3-phosphate acyltransferase